MFTTYYRPKNKEQFFDCVNKIFKELKESAPYGDYKSHLYFKDFTLNVKYESSNGYGNISFYEGDEELVSENLVWNLEDWDYEEYEKEQFHQRIDYAYEELLSSIEGNVDFEED